jgi:hypothetical protein
MAGRKRKQDVPLEPLRLRVHPAIIEGYEKLSEATGVHAADLERAALELGVQNPDQLRVALETGPEPTDDA